MASFGEISCDKNVVTLNWDIHNCELLPGETESRLFEFLPYEEDRWTIILKKSYEIPGAKFCLCFKGKTDNPVRVSFQFSLTDQRREFQSPTYTIDFRCDTVSEPHNFEEVSLNEPYKYVLLKCRLWKHQESASEVEDTLCHFVSEFVGFSSSNNKNIGNVNYIRLVSRLNFESTQFILPIPNFPAFSQVRIGRLIFSHSSPYIRKLICDVDLHLTSQYNIMLEIAPTEDSEKIKFLQLTLFILDIHSKKHLLVKNKNAVLAHSGAFKIILQVNKLQLLSKRSIYLHGNTIIFHFEMLYAKKYKHYIAESSYQPELKLTLPKTTHLNYVDEPDRCLSDALRNLFLEGKLSDVTLQASGKDFPAHKAILSARSPVFEAMFTSDMREKTSKIIEIPDIKPETLSAMLVFMYSERMENLDMISARKLYSASDKYQFLQLKERCSEYIKEHLSPCEACKCLVLADRHSDNHLKTFVIEFVTNNHFAVFSMPEWKQMVAAHPVLSGEIMISVSSHMCKS